MGRYSPAPTPGADGGTFCIIKPATASAPARKGEAQSLLGELKLSVSLVEQQSGKPACCKSDGLRFAGADTTVKLRNGVAYVLSISITPAVAAAVERVEVKHRQAECPEPSALCCCWPQANTPYADLSETEWSEPDVLPLRERGDGAPAAATKAVFEAVWECSMPLTKHGVRGELAIDIGMQDFGVLTVPVTACKVYADGDASAAHGMQLRSINYAYGRSGLTGEVKLRSCSYNK